MPFVAEQDAQYYFGDSEAEQNAYAIADVLLPLDFCIEAVCAIIGNIQHEGLMNPWYWEDQNTPTWDVAHAWTADELKRHGYGFFQYTYFTKYVNTQNESLDGYAPHFSDRQGDPSDGEAQLLFMNQDIYTGNWSSSQLGYYAPSFQSILGIDISQWYPTSPDDFKAGNIVGNTPEEKVENLTGVFELQYEAPTNEPPSPSDPIGYRATYNYSLRVYDALLYYDLLKDYSPSGSKFDLMYYLKPWWKRRIL